MVNKFLFIGSGSPSDPGFDDVRLEYHDGSKLDRIPYREFMKARGITVVDKIIESCHGCYDLMSSYSHQMETLHESPDTRVVVVLQGGLLFGLPSIQATQTSFPIISCPTDFIAYSAFMVPSGHAVVAGVGVEKKGAQTQREKALLLAERILNLDHTQVNAVADLKTSSKLVEKLKSYGLRSVNGFGEGYISPGMCLVYGGPDELKGVPEGCFAIRADSDEDVNSWAYMGLAEDRHNLAQYNRVPTAQVRGMDNLAIFAAKVISCQDKTLIGKIRGIGEKKRASYAERNLLKELQK